MSSSSDEQYKSILISEEIQSCYIECHSLPSKERNDSTFRVILTNDFFYLSTNDDRCVGCITSDGSFIILMINNKATLNDLPKKSFARLLLKDPKRFQTIMDFSTTPFLSFSEHFFINLKHLSVTGPVNVYMECHHRSSISVSFTNGARSCIHLSSAKTQVSISQKSSLKILGTITDVVVDRLDTDSSLDLCDCKLETNVECSFTIPTVDPIGDIFIHPSMSFIREMIVDTILQQRSLKTAELERQRYVRCDLKIPSFKENADEVSSDDEKVCKTCYTYVANAKFDCGHVYMCLSCAEKLRSIPNSRFECPLCRNHTKTVTIDTLDNFNDVTSSIKKNKRQRVNYSFF
jgi:hypothetical protein